MRPHASLQPLADQTNSRGVRRVNVRMREKAIADGNVEQMFGMNIKQQGIEVQGDQVSAILKIVSEC